MLEKIKAFFKTHLQVLVAISVATGALAAWAADQINLMQLLERLAGLFGVLMLVVLLALPQAQAQTFEIGYEVMLEPGQVQTYQEPGLELAGYMPQLPEVRSGFFVYGTYDLFLFELEAIDTQFYLSPSVELIFGSRYWLELQFLVDSPLFTASARTKYESSGRLESRLGLLITPFD